MTPTIRRTLTLTATAIVAVTATAALGVGSAAADTAHHIVLAAGNPLDGVSPDLGVFGPALNSTWKRVLAGIWGVAMAACAVWVILASVQYRQAKSRGFSGQMNEGRQGMVDAFIAFGACASSGVLIGAVLFVVGT